jgi:hypothetical protein
MSSDQVTVAVDPGVHAAGVAIFRGQELRAARLCREASYLFPVDPWDAVSEAVAMFLAGVFTTAEIGRRQLVIEVPQIYSKMSDVDQNDLITLAGAAGAIVCRVGRMFARIHKPNPADWKGQVPKDIMVRRVKGKLTRDEHARIELPAPSFQHNVYDAVGIGLHRVGRLGV